MSSTLRSYAGRLKRKLLKKPAPAPSSSPPPERTINSGQFELSARLKRAFPDLVAHGAPSGNDDLHFQDIGLRGAVACTPAEATLLYHAAKYCAPKTPLEIGSYIGWSSAHIASALDTTLTCVDPFLEIGPDLREVTSEPARKRFTDNLTRAGVMDKIKLVCGKSPEVLPTSVPPGGWDFAFVDGWHIQSQPTRDIAGLIPHLSASPIVILHDLWIADVRDALCYLRMFGWDYVILNTSNYLTLAWKNKPGWLEDFLRTANESRFINPSSAVNSQLLVRGLNRESIDPFCKIAFDSITAFNHQRTSI